MQQFLLNKKKEVENDLQDKKCQKVNIALSLSYMKSLDMARRRYEAAKGEANKSVRTIFSVSMNILAVTIIYVGLNVNIVGLAIAAYLLLGISDLGMIAMLSKELLTMHREGKIIKEGGFDPFVCEDMAYIDNKSQELYENLKSIENSILNISSIDQILSDAITANDYNLIIEEYPMLIREYLESEYQEYLKEIETIKPQDVHFESIVSDEYSYPKAYKLK